MTNKEFDEACNKYWTLMLCYAKRYIKADDYYHAQEITSQVFLSLWKASPVFDNEQKMKAWLYITTKRRCINRLKHIHASKEVFGTDCILESDDFITEHDAKEIELLEIKHEVISGIIARADKLTKRQKQIFELYYLKQYTPQEIADALNIKQHSIHSQLNQIHARLKINTLKP